MSSTYVLDANAIRELSYDQICEKKRDDRLIATIEDVKYEVRNLEKIKALNIETLNSNAFQKMSEIINKYQCVRNVIDYYNNKGTGDVGLLAYSLTINEGTFFKDEVYIVTNDRGLRTACDELGSKWLSVDDFNSI